jgi:hypothetical protein
MKKNISFLIFFVLCNYCFAQNVGINPTGTVPNPSAGLDVDFVNKGLLIPRIALIATNNASPIVSPAISLLVYNTETAGTAPNNVVPGYYFWDGTQWVSFSGGSGALNYIPKWISANSLSSTSLLFDNGTNVGIGTTTPSEKLEVVGNIKSTGGTIHSNAFGALLSTGSGNTTSLMAGRAGGGLGASYQPASAGVNGGNLSIEAGGASHGAKGGDVSIVSGDAFDGGSQGGNIFLKSGGYQNWTPGYIAFFTGASHPHGLGNPPEQMRISGSGNVGIGTTVPSSKLDMAGDFNVRAMSAPAVSPATQGRIYFDSGTNKFKVSEHGGAYVDLIGGNIGGGWTDGGANVYLTSITDNVGIGTTTPSSKLEVQGTVKIVDGSQGTGKVLTSDAMGLASWQTPVVGHTIGESYGGGIVFYVYDNGQHGLIAATADQNIWPGIRWNAGTDTNTMAYADGVGAGKANTAIIIANQGYGDGSTYAARICNEYSITVAGVTYGDWYLPSKFELNLLYLQRSVVGGFATNLGYWSSTEILSNSVSRQYFGNGSQSNDSKYATYAVRAVRAF